MGVFGYVCLAITGPNVSVLADMVVSCEGFVVREQEGGTLFCSDRIRNMDWISVFVP